MIRDDRQVALNEVRGQLLALALALRDKPPGARDLLTTIRAGGQEAENRLLGFMAGED